MIKLFCDLYDKENINHNYVEQSICKKLALVCKLMANSEEHKSHKKKLLKYAGEFEGLSKIKSLPVKDE